MDSIVGLLLVYVDDLLIAGSDEVLSAVSKAIEGVWTIPSWTRAHVEGVRFCGLEVVQGAGSRSPWKPTQVMISSFRSPEWSLSGGMLKSSKIETGKL